jgi:hypothetical protein
MHSQPHTSSILFHLVLGYCLYVLQNSKVQNPQYHVYIFCGDMYHDMVKSYYQTPNESMGITMRNALHKCANVRFLKFTVKILINVPRTFSKYWTKMAKLEYCPRVVIDNNLHISPCILCANSEFEKSDISTFVKSISHGDAHRFIGRLIIGFYHIMVHIPFWKSARNIYQYFVRCGGSQI